MSDWLLAIPAFIVAIGVLVAVHEFGHFWVARRLGVKVLRYSIGFGNRIWGRVSTRSGTEYRLSAIPLGGYVKMLDEREVEVPADQQHLAFNRKSVWRRMAIVAAGPGINFLFAIVLYWVVFMLGVPALKPVIGEVAPETPAAEVGLMRGGEVVKVGGEPVDSWQTLRLTVVSQKLGSDQMSMTVQTDDGNRRQVTLDLSGVSTEPKQLFKDLGLQPFRPHTPPLVADVLADSPAAHLGLESGDLIVQMNQETIESPRELVQWIETHPGERVTVGIKRDGQLRTLTGELGSTRKNGQTSGHLGVRVGVDLSQWQSLRTVRQYGPLAAMPAAVSKTWAVTSLTFRMLWRMVLGDVSWRNISGPIQIADYAGETASRGLDTFLSFLALISVSLAVLNLLPIPVLDGGHLLYYLVELVRGKPLSEKAQAAGQQIGMAALFMLMALAFYNDITRVFG